MSKYFIGPLGSKQLWEKVSYINPMGLTYEDVLLVPQGNTEVVSRSHVDTSVQFGPFLLKIPVISAPMNTISGEVMVRKLAELGALGTLPRGDLDTNLEICTRLTEDNIPCLYAIGLKDGLEIGKRYAKHGAKMLLIDVAHGGQKEVVRLAREIEDSTGIDVAAGNIATYSQASWYKRNRLRYVRVGIGPGGMCSTRLVAGTGIAQLSAVLDTSSTGVDVIADGGIRYPGDVAKALAAGAKVVMIGSLFAGCEETPGEIIEGKKKVHGQASADYMKDNNVTIDINRAPEGISISVNVKGSVSSIIEEISGGLRSAMSYSNSHNIEQFQKRSIFVSVSSSTQRENKPHINSD